MLESETNWATIARKTLGAREGVENNPIRVLVVEATQVNANIIAGELEKIKKPFHTGPQIGHVKLFETREFCLNGQTRNIKGENVTATADYIAQQAIDNGITAALIGLEHQGTVFGKTVADKLKEKNFKGTCVIHNRFPLSADQKKLFSDTADIKFKFVTTGDWRAITQALDPSTQVGAGIS